MPRVFTRYLRALASGREPADEETAAVWTALRAALRDELRRRGLWGASPPSYLGIYGNPPPSHALEELAAGCYAFIFVDRLRSLTTHLAVKPDVEGLVLLDVRHYVHELQRKHDPLGFRVFAAARAAVQGALDRGELAVVAGDPRLRNDTVLGWEVRSSPATTTAGARDEVAIHVTAWCDELLPDLVTARGPRQPEMVDRLRRQLLTLRDAGIERFAFRDLLDPLKQAVRRRWAAVLEQSIAARDGTGPGPIARSDAEAEAAESGARFAELARCVSLRLERLEVDARTRRYLVALWRFLGRRASLRGGKAKAEEEGEAVLARRKVAELLHIPRERMPELYRILGRLVTGCGARLGAMKTSARDMMDLEKQGLDEP
jgi:hypothetical protein